MGGGKKKGQKKQNKEETTSSSESDALQDMFMDVMKEDDDTGNNMFRTPMQMDDEMAQEALSKMKQAFAENGKKFGVQKLSFEAGRTMDTRKQKHSSTGGQGTARKGKSGARESNARGGTAGTLSEEVQRRTETNHD